MSRIGDLRAELAAALAVVPGVVVTPMGGAVDPPCLVISPPELAWEAYAPAPTSATFEVAAVVPADGDAAERLWSLAEPVAMAVEAVDDAVVRSARPQLLQVGREELPSYSFQIEVSL